MARPGTPFSPQEAHELAQAADKAGRHDDAKRIRDEFGQAGEPAAPRRLSSVPDPSPAPAKPRERFNARRVLGRTGFRLRDELTPGFAKAGRIASGAVGVDRGGSVSTFLLAVIGGLLSLILLDLLISERGSSITSAATGWIGGAVQRLASPTDPLTSPGRSSAPPLSTTAPAKTSKEGIVDSPVPTSLIPKVAQPGKPAGRPVPIPGGNHTVDAAYLTLTEWIAKTFGVTVVSGWRSVVENTRVGGAPRSDHLAGRAVDFAGPPATLERLKRFAVAAGFPFVAGPGDPGHSDHVHISFWRP